MKLTGLSLEQVLESGEDIFERDPFADGLLRIFSECDDPLVVVLDEQWGTGKTVFAHRLCERAKEQGFQTIYFDAFKKDYNPDVFVALAAEIIAVYPSGSEKKKFEEKAKGVAKIACKFAGNVAIKALSQGMMDLEEVSKAGSDIANVFSAATEIEL